MLYYHYSIDGTMLNQSGCGTHSISPSFLLLYELRDLLSLSNPDRRRREPQMKMLAIRQQICVSCMTPCRLDWLQNIVARCFVLGPGCLHWWYQYKLYNHPRVENGSQISSPLIKWLWNEFLRSSLILKHR